MRYRPPPVNTVRSWSWQGRRLCCASRFAGEPPRLVNLSFLPEPFELNDGCNMVVARRRLSSPWSRQPTGYGCILCCASRSRSLARALPHEPRRLVCSSARIFSPHTAAAATCAAPGRRLQETRAGGRRRRRGPSRRPHEPERASRQGCFPRKRRRGSLHPSTTISRA